MRTGDKITVVASWLMGGMSIGFGTESVWIGMGSLLLTGATMAMVFEMWERKQ